MARGFSYSGAGTVYTPYFGGINRGFITINSVSFNESTGKITINWNAGFHCIYDDGNNDSGGNCSAIAACFGGSVYDDALYLDNGGTYYSNYMAHPRGTVEGQTGACLLYAEAWDGTKIILKEHDHVINATSSLTYGVKTQMNYGWGWLNRWDGRQSNSVFQNINGGTLYFTLPQYDIEYEANGGSSTPTKQTKNYNANITVAGGISRLGYKFTGWKASNNTVYQGGDTYSANASTKLTAQWTAEQYSITYDANGGSGAPSKQTYTYDASASVNLSSTEPTRTGYTFKGWSTSNTATSASYSAGQAWRRNNMGNYTLYAVWEINQYYIDLNGRLDGSDTSNLGVYGSADITVNGTKVLQGGTDYYSKHNYGSTYSITNIKANSGYQYDGVQAGQTSGTIGTSDVSVRLKFSTTKPSQVQANGSWTSPFDIELSWSAVGLNINYTIYYKKDSENNYTTINCGSQLRANIAVEEETTYNIYILATNAGGSTASNTLSITTPADQAKIRVKTQDGWHKGKTWYRRGNTWVKVKKIYIKVGENWVIGTNYEN